MRSTLFAAALMLFALPVAAGAYRAVNLLYVVPISKDTFEVLESRGAGPSDMWCAAADYARAAGLDGARKRMYISSPRGKSRTTANAKGVVFTTNPGDDIKNTARSYTISVNRMGENLPIDHAHEFCFDGMFDTLRNF